MFHRFSTLVLGLTLILGLAGCQSSGAQAVDPTPAASATIATAPTAMPPSTPAAFEPTKPATGTLENGGLMVQYHDASSKASLVLVDVTNGAQCPVMARWTLIGLGAYLYSPDYKKLAIVEYPQPKTQRKPHCSCWTSAPGRPSRWRCRLLGWVQTLAMSPDGSRIAVATSGAKDNLALVDAKEMAVTATTHVPNFVRGLGFTRDGEGLMAYASNEDPQSGLASAPHRRCYSRDRPFNPLAG